MVQPHEPTRSGLQDELDAMPAGGTLQLLPREFAGPLTISHPVVIDGQGATLWSLRGPVLSVRSRGVTVRNLKVEVTGEDEPSPADDGSRCSIAVDPGCSPLLDNVEVRGEVVGLAEEEGSWAFPHAIRLGHLAHGVEHDFTVRLILPCPCRLTSNIAGLDVSPHGMKAGRHEVRLHIERLAPDTLLSGWLCLSSTFLKRNVLVNALILPPGKGSETHARGTGQVAWEPQGWSTPDGESPRPVALDGPPTAQSDPGPPTVPDPPEATLPPPPPEPQPPALPPEPVRVPPRHIEPDPVPRAAPPAPAPPQAVPTRPPNRPAPTLRPITGPLVSGLFHQPPPPAPTASTPEPPPPGPTSPISAVFEPSPGPSKLSAPQTPPSPRPAGMPRANPLFGALPVPKRDESPPGPPSDPGPAPAPSIPDPVQPAPRKVVRPGGISSIFGPTKPDDASS